MDNISESNDNSNVTSGMPDPVAYGKDPDSLKLKGLYKNIEDNKLIKSIKAIEQQLLDAENKPSVSEDIEEVAEELGDAKPSLHKTGSGNGIGKKNLLMKLLKDFEELLTVPYGAIGYLVMSDSESIRHLYGVDASTDFYAMVDDTRIRISSERLGKMIIAGGGKMFLGEGGEILDDPAETSSNEKLADDAINGIIRSIRDMLSDA